MLHSTRVTQDVVGQKNKRITICATNNHRYLFGIQQVLHA